MGFLSSLKLAASLSVWGGVLHCYSSEYSCFSDCDYSCVEVDSCDHHDDFNFICTPSLKW